MPVLPTDKSSRDKKKFLFVVTHILDNEEAGSFDNYFYRNNHYGSPSFSKPWYLFLDLTRVGLKSGLVLVKILVQTRKATQSVLLVGIMHDLIKSKSNRKSARSARPN